MRRARRATALLAMATLLAPSAMALALGLHLEVHHASEPHHHAHEALAHAVDYGAVGHGHAHATTTPEHQHPGLTVSAPAPLAKLLAAASLPHPLAVDAERSAVRLAPLGPSCIGPPLAAPPILRI